MTKLLKQLDVLNRSASHLGTLRPLFTGTNGFEIPSEVCEVVYNSLADVECELRRVIAALEADNDDTGPGDGGEPMPLAIAPPRLRLVCERLAA